jgi:hypothetical protein
VWLLDCGSGPVGWEREDRLATVVVGRERFLPPGHELVSVWACKERPLQDRVVGVSEFRRGWRLGARPDLCLVEGGEVDEEDSHRPAVGDDVVERQLLEVLGWAEPEQERPGERGRVGGRTAPWPLWRAGPSDRGPRAPRTPHGRVGLSRPGRSWRAACPLLG